MTADKFNSFFSAPCWSSAHVKRRLALCYILAMSLAYVFVRVHMPSTIFPGAPHDDTLYMAMGRYIAVGEWLGKFNEYTLMKGPGYPFFLALVNWSGFPLSLALGLFHASVIAFFTVIAHRFIQSYFLSGLLFTFLLWCPMPLSHFLSRTVRDQIYYIQIFLVIGAFVAAWFCPADKRMRLYAVIGGLAFGWFWLTREEGVWFLPAVALFLVSAALHARRTHTVWRFAQAVAIVLLAFLAVNAAFRGMNWWHYGSFVGVDFKEKQFQRALGAVHSIRSGGVKQYVSITHHGRQLLYAVSPTFSLLKYYLDGSPGVGWSAISCSVGQSTCNDKVVCSTPCNELGAGYFIFAIRHAASGIGMYDTPKKASAFFKQLADEIEAACASGKLECQPQLINELPPLTWDNVRDEIWIDIKRGIKLLSMFDLPSHIGGSGRDDDIAPWLQFLNYPRYQLGTDNHAMATYVLSGWFWKGDTADWITFTAKYPTGEAAYVSVDRTSSADFTPGTNQRFVIRVRCGDQCLVRVVASDGSSMERSLGEFRSAPVRFEIGEGRMHIDDAKVQTNTQVALLASDHFADRYRLRVVKYYNDLFFPVMIAGMFAFAIASLWHWRSVVWNVCYILALASWGLVAARIGLLMIMAITANSAVVFQHAYAIPAYILLASGTVFSLAAFAQLFWPHWFPDRRGQA